MSTDGIRQRDVLVERLQDRRSRQVVFLSHCLLNENTRYLGGACRTCCVREIVEQCLEADIGMVQMPCPEQQAWGGVLKRHMLRLYGTQATHPLAHGLQRLLLRAALLHTRMLYRNMARRVARQIEDYLSSGFSVLGVVGVDGSPPCGVRKSVDVGGCVAAISALDPHAVSVEQQNALVRRHARAGQGIFIQELVRELRQRRLDVPLSAHDLFDELDGRSSSVKLV